MKRVTITFDYEGKWGMPHKVEFDQDAVTRQLLSVLQKHQAKAVFFVTGRLIEEYPAVIKMIHDNGHEIGLHGYTHEHMNQLSQTQVTDLTASLERSGIELKKMGLPIPVGFRAPYLMGPEFYDPKVYLALKGIGMRWISNREIRMPEELARPDRLSFLTGILRRKHVRNLMLLALNIQLLVRDTVAPGIRVIAASKWLLSGAKPFLRPEGLMEYPLTSPLDCDMLGLIPPQVASSQPSVEFARHTIMKCFDVSGEYFNINCHDWITGTQNRLQILDDVLTQIGSHKDIEFWLPGRSEDEA